LFGWYKSAMYSLLRQIKKRRLALGFKQTDMQERVGIMRQVYQRLESKGNPRLTTLELVATGLNSELMLIPLDKVAAIRALLESSEVNQLEPAIKTENLEDDPWNDILESDS
jgi:transcriptional regulator with XRE-family HTH domain